MGRDPAAFRVAQLVLQGLGERLHAGFGDVVGRIAGRGRDALLGSGVDDEPRFAMGDHLGGENLRAVDHAPEIDMDDPVPVRLRSEHAAAGLQAGIVHQHVTAPKRARTVSCRWRTLARSPTSVAAASTSAAAGRNGCDCVGRFVKPFVVPVGDAHPHPERGEVLGGRKLDAGGPAGHDGNKGGSQCRMDHGPVTPPLPAGFECRLCSAAMNGTRFSCPLFGIRVPDPL